ncbi:hypothetical protein TBLA_0I02950 [Henningerozyma blattae CBS 6284]|uniref:SYO1-like TPR repeats domain-containing protein n=1 Tax=Henningerozyma blattae (strain ATCC 34711 / CBS 6284 / DSM 70876 / NBRC 10599 / NRRL Y-10934 / UCD 77-7) TaxID=1071380 RepID=I2H999_HENB6|nr:hypothetical protein TBLA_0I02950 [Tetrapisispora blattae CBS 6284]CCH62951.1 hypothetical protein TBLA_0I02950 [Tetrapisispora blattae CBS 6284]
MGKSKKRSRTSKARLNPISGRPDVRNAAKDNALVTKRIQPLLKQLESAIANDRHMSLSSVSVLCEDTHMRSLFLREKLVQIILKKLITDDNTEIVVESYGLLRNITLEEGYDISTHLWRSDIWTSIIDGFNKIENSLNALNDTNNKSSKESKSLLFDFTDNLLSLVVALANGSDKILDELLSEDKLTNIFKILTYLLQFGIDKIPLKLLNTILDLIYDFSSESFQFIESVSNHDYLSKFVSQLPNMIQENEKNQASQQFNELTKVLVQGIYIQFLDMNLTIEQTNSIIHGICTSIDSIDIKQVFHDLSSKTDDEELIKAKDSTVAEKIKDYTKRRSSAMMRVQSIEIAIDLLTAVIELLAALYEEQKHTKNKDSLPDDLIVTLAEFLPHAFMALSENFTPRILIVWNNLLWLYITVGINIFDLNNEPYKQLWSFLTDISTDLTNHEITSIKMGKESVIWALLKTGTLQPEPAKVLEYFNLINNVDFVNTYIKEFESFQAETAEDTIEYKQRILGVLSTYALYQGQIEVNRVIGQFFMNLLIKKDLHAVLTVEIINSLFEIYGDKNFDYDEDVFVKDDFLRLLQEQIVPNVRLIFKLVDKNRDPQLKERCNETFNNLDSFIHYKMNERS